MRSTLIKGKEVATVAHQHLFF